MRRPDPPPVEVNDPAIVGAGTLAWGLATLALVLAKAAGADIHPWWIEMGVAGIVGGSLGWAYCRRRRNRRRDEPESEAKKACGRQSDHKPSQPEG